MMRRNGLSSLLFIVVATVLLFGGTLVAGNSPLLGLDLQGGVSVVYEPAGEASGESLSQAIEIIRRRIDALGVAEPEIARQGDAIVVQLPGVKDPDEALDVIGQTAELRFRPVLGTVPVLDPDAIPPTPTTGGEGETTTSTAGDAEPAEPTTTTAPPASDDEQGSAVFPGGPGLIRQPDQTQARQTIEDPTTTTVPTTAPAAEPEPPAPGEDLPFELPEDFDPSTLEDFDPDMLDLGGFELTPPEGDVAEAEVILDSREGERLRLGPTMLTGEALEGAEARLDQAAGGWSVSITMRGGEKGIDAFNAAALQCNTMTPLCPSGRLAIVLDGTVQSAPTIQQPSFERDSIQITGQFTESEAKDLALVLKFGALPVELVPQQTQAVSATLGKDALNAGVTAGLVGLALVALYMIIYYRLLGVVAMLSLTLSASLLWVVISYLGESRGLALTLAGVTGIIVSIGVAVDSNVVFYEHLKEDVSRGRSLRSCVDGSFASAFSTIVKADIASLIGAGVLWWLTVGPVRGFAFYLGLSVLLDLVASYFFMRPLTLILVKSRRLQGRNRLFGLPADPEVVAS